MKTRKEFMHDLNQITEDEKIESIITAYLNEIENIFSDIEIRLEGIDLRHLENIEDVYNISKESSNNLH